MRCGPAASAYSRKQRKRCPEAIIGTTTDQGEAGRARSLRQVAVSSEAATGLLRKTLPAT